jgi:hypothetical protein
VIVRFGIVLLVAVLLLAGCGGDESTSSGGGSSSGGHNRPKSAKYTQDEVIEALGLHWTDDHVDAEDDTQECVASVVFTRAEDMKPYVEAGDPVATNPSGEVGVKVGSYEGVDQQVCFDRFQQALKKPR